MANIICGVDVSSQVLDARIDREGPSGRFKRTAEGITELAEFCRRHASELVVLEATGGYETAAAAALARGGRCSAAQGVDC